MVSRSEVSTLFAALARARSRFEAQPRMRRELILLGLALLVGLLLVPWLVWLVGSAVLGEYASGGPFALLGDYFAGLLQGSLIFWLVALGPYVFFLLLRLLFLWIRQPRGLSQVRRPSSSGPANGV